MSGAKAPRLPGRSERGRRSGSRPRRIPEGTGSGRIPAYGKRAGELSRSVSLPSIGRLRERSVGTGAQLLASGARGSSGREPQTPGAAVLARLCVLCPWRLRRLRGRGERSAKGPSRKVARERAGGRMRRNCAGEGLAFPTGVPCFWGAARPGSPRGRVSADVGPRARTERRAVSSPVPPDPVGNFGIRDSPVSRSGWSSCAILARTPLCGPSCYGLCYAFVTPLLRLA